MKVVMQSIFLLIFFMIISCSRSSSQKEVTAALDAIEKETPGEETPGEVTPEFVGFGIAELNNFSVGLSHSCIVNKVDGSAKCWGNNAYGQLGLEDKKNRGDETDEMGDKLEKVKFDPDLKVAGFYTGGTHTCAIFTNKQVKCWGWNFWGQLGIGVSARNWGDSDDPGMEKLEFVNLGPDRTAKSMALGMGHTCVLLDNDKVKCWGLNSFGQLGYGDKKNRGQGIGDMTALSEVDLGEVRTVKKIFAGPRAYATCAIMENNSLKCWGRNGDGQLGLGDKDNRGVDPSEMGGELPEIDLGLNRYAIKVAVGEKHTCALLDNNEVKCWGLNDKGQLGLGNNGGLDPDNELYEMGDKLENVEFGDGHTAKDLTVGKSHTCVITTDDNVKCWGENAFGALGIDSKADKGSKTSDMENLKSVKLEKGEVVIPIEIHAGEDFTCTQFLDNNVKCWGLNDSGQLGQEGTTNVSDGTGPKVKHIENIQLGF